MKWSNTILPHASHSVSHAILCLLQTQPYALTVTQEHRNHQIKAFTLHVIPGDRGLLTRSCRTEQYTKSPGCLSLLPGFTLNLIQLTFLLPFSLLHIPFSYLQQ